MALPAAGIATDPVEGRRFRIGGTVQGVGFRPWVHRIAARAGVSGRVCNDSAGATIEVFGAAAAIGTFRELLSSDLPPAARIETIAHERIAPEHLDRFEIVPSRHGADRRVAIPADLATCPECVAEIFDPDNRRYLYPFTNCTNCGPRFTITREVPYDRPSTTMAAFEMCDDCRREYESPANRRFHAEPNACPECGPQLRLFIPSSSSRKFIPSSDQFPIGDQLELLAAESDGINSVLLGEAALAICSGKIVALKGIGGFHLVCDAANPAAVRRLRERKRRDAKPFAVMARDIAEAERLAVVTDAGREALLGSVRPIVILRRRDSAPLAPEIAPDSPTVGVMLPYSPLHHLLIAQARRPLVMTSGNLSDEPIAFRNDEAAARLGSVADLFVLHDREIETRCDDSVVRVIGAAPTVIRRSRGYVPRPIAVAPPFARPVLACGAQLKNTFCIGVGDRAYLGPHIGDLDNLETFESFEESIARMERFIGVRPELIAHDMHPDYLSTAYALRRDPRAIAVQHHHAHVASAMAEHRLAGPVLGLAFDGTGYGPDGNAWGGEFVAADFAGFERLATFRPIALAGGDSAIRNVWRIALALLDDAFGGDPPLDKIGALRAIEPRQIEVVRAMISARLNTTMAHGVGRYFDAFGAIVLGAGRAEYEGQVAMRLEWAAEPSERGRYAFDMDSAASPAQIDLRAAVRETVRDLAAGVPAAAIAARFHNTIVAASAETVRIACAGIGRVPIVMSGGCFQNARLAEGIAAALSPRFDIYMHRAVPPGDGGIALGQAMVAGARSRESERS